MREREKAVVGVDYALKPPAEEVKANDMTSYVVTGDSTPCAAIPAHIPRHRTIKICCIITASMIYEGKRVYEGEQSRAFIRMAEGMREQRSWGREWR